MRGRKEVNEDIRPMMMMMKNRDEAESRRELMSENGFLPNE